MDSEGSAAGVVSALMRRRASVRAFCDRPVPPETIRQILEDASRSPSTGNIQPWHVDVVVGEALDLLKNAATTALEGGGVAPDTGGVYPHGLWEPYRARRGDAAAARSKIVQRAVGDSRLVMQEILERNYRFFDAPVGLVFSIDRRMLPAQWVDLGIFMQSVMLLAQDRGLDTCPQAIWVNQSDTLRKVLSIEERLQVVAGMAVGYRRSEDPFVQVASARAPFEEYVNFHGADI